MASPHAEAVAARGATLIRNQYFLWTRLAVRLVEAVTLVTQARSGHGLAIGVAAGFALYDLVLAGALRRALPVPLWLRLCLDSADVAGWSLAIGSPPDAAALVAAPLALEMGMRFGWRGAVVPAVVGVTTSAALFAAGRPAHAAPFIWPLQAMVLGALVIRYLRLRLEDRLRAAATATEAAASHAELAGQNSVAMGVDTVVDLLSRTTSLLSASGAGAPASSIGVWRNALAEASVSTATYLGVALARWQRRWNSLSGDLSADVELHCADGAGALLLSPAQARALDRALERLAPRGHVAVRVPRPAPVGREQVLLLGGRRVVVQADPGPAVASLDPGPMAVLIGATTFPTHSLPWSDGVPLWVTLPLVVTALAVAVWAHRRVDRIGAAAHPGILAAGLALGTADALSSTVAMPHHALARWPFLLFLLWFGPLFVLYARDLTRVQRWLTVAGAGAAIAAGLALLHQPVPPLAALVAAVWPAVAFLVSRGLRDGLERDAADVQAEVDRRHEAATEEAYRRGRRLVVELAARAAEDAGAACARSRERLAPDVVAEVERRLAEVARRLAALRASGVHSSPTDRTPPPSSVLRA